MALIVYNGISAFHLAVPCMVFQDMFVDKPAPFDLQMVALEDGEIRSSSGFTISFANLTTRSSAQLILDADLVIVPGWPDDLPTPPYWLLEVLKQAYQRGAKLAGFCLGAFVIAAAGILDGSRATTHWAYADQLRQQFPDVVVDPKPLFIESEGIMTSAGIAASLDCCLHLVRLFLGSSLATELARVLVTAPFRSGGQQQYIPTPKIDIANFKVSFGWVLEDISQHLNLEVNVDLVAARCAMSRRTFTRQFKATFGCTFGDWLLNQRLKYSQQILETSDASIGHIAAQAGFGSESVFRKHFKRAFNVTPKQWRSSFSSRVTN
ncbi:GlxA family transcriptional regulator [Shewanella jiangmenensis]|uniref:GlxA family transcriptional regulator n=1 Tax=Shewanella jiangmenensis TaxID=2837387 RepID=UPI0032D9786D